ncbi:MAG: hypothetical protein CVT95_11175 [Bacteroidetes bacterium HGW-Bacteroidetes-12]|nr:MAG: hypothetical protein CVT95_11175 [Bacteroidetes bacterium HGW-Bacteroidetes-12]
MPIPSISQIVAFLQTGKHNAITAREIAEHFNISDGGVEVAIRDVIRGAIGNGELIGSTNQGFFLIADESDYLEYIRSLESRRDEIGNRINHLTNNWTNRRQ